MVKVAPSILSADFSNLEEEIKRMEQAGADMMHLDIMDGHFVPNITFGAPVVSKIRKCTDLPFDVHLMIEHPENYINDFFKAGADIITVHAEACVHLNRTLNMIKDLGIKAGVAINPATPVSSLSEVYDIADLILVMSVNPGFSGQKFIASSVNKVKRVQTAIELADKKGIIIEVDGGVDENTAPLLKAAGATLLVSGSAVFGSDNPSETIRKIKE